VQNRIYLDNAATTKPKKEVIELAISLLKEHWENPNSIYSFGKFSREIIEDSRKTIANKINANPEEIIFCPSASAANSLAILGYLRKNRVECFVTSNIEHDSILNIEMPLHVKRELVECNTEGIISPTLLNKYKNSLVSIGAANSEIGTIQDLKLMSVIVHKNNCVFHSDLTQYIPYYPVDVKEIGLDMATFSAHKLGGLRGCAVLYVKKGIDLSPLIAGHQEKGLMGGTENTIAIACMGKAMELLNYENTINLTHLSVYLFDCLDNCGINFHFNGDFCDRLANNTNICINDLKIDNQQLISLLDLENIQVSAGSACNAGTNKPSRVLKAIGLSDDEVNKSIRITIGNETTYEDIDRFVQILKNIIEMNK